MYSECLKSRCSKSGRTTVQISYILWHSKTACNQLSKIRTYFNAIKPFTNSFLYGFRTLCHLDFRHCLKSGRTVNRTQTSCPKSKLVRISETHYTSMDFRHPIICVMPEFWTLAWISGSLVSENRTRKTSDFRHIRAELRSADF